MRVTSGGRATIPKPIRDRLGIVPGSAVGLELAPDSLVVLLKVDRGQRVSPFEMLRGRAGAGLTTDEIMALTRGEGPAHDRHGRERRPSKRGPS